MDKTLAALKAYTNDFYKQVTFGESNVVCSPLGSWLLLAASAASLNLENNPELKARIERSLHLPVGEAEKTVKEILEAYPALNFVSQAWTSPNLNALPAIAKWVEGNNLIPHEGFIPSQEQVDEWASSNTNELIKKFPATMNEAVMLIIANIIYSKFMWSKKFHTIPAPEVMSGWNVENVMSVFLTDDSVRFARNGNGDVFAIYDVEAASKYDEFVRLVTCLNRNVEPAELVELATDVDSMEPLELDEEILLTFDSDVFRIKEVKQGIAPYVIETAVPAWEAESKHDLLGDNGLGFKELVEAFNEGATSPLESEVKQVAVAKFDKDGFEAAALTSLVMVRSAMPQRVKQTVYELNFTKPFAFISYTDGLPLFSGYISNAKESE